MTKPITHQHDVAKLPRALAPLIERPQWCIWRWTEVGDRWTKPPFIARDPQRHASTSNPGTWADYATALAAVQAGHADGISYVLTEDDPFAAIDIDNCRCLITHSIDIWAQNFLDTGRHSYSEITPSGTGCRIWGFASGASLNRKFSLEIDGKPIAAELFRRTNKVLTVTGLTLNPAIRELTAIDRVIDWAVIWGERRKAAAAAASAPINGHSFAGTGSGYDVEQIEQIVRTGAPDGANRSDLFHTIVGHYVGCGWDEERIFAHLQEHPQGIGERYLREDRLRQEITRSAVKFAKPELPSQGNGGWIGGWQAKAPQPEPNDQLDEQDELDCDLDEELPEPEIDPDEPELQDDDDLDDDDLDEEPPPRSDIPPLYAHGDPDPRPLKTWMIKGLMPAVGHGLLSGQWGAGKTFVVFELAGSLMTAQPFLGHTVKRQCGVLLIAAEGTDEVRLRLDAVVREKCGSMQKAPFYWYETAPVLLQKGAAEKLIAMARQAEASSIEEFGLPIGLIAIDTVAACAGYIRAGDENDNAVGQAIMNVMKTVAQALNCFVLGVDHFGKDMLAGTRGAYSKESAADLVLACLGDKEISGSVTNTRLAVRKNRGGSQGHEHPFTLRLVEAPEPDEDGEAITTRVVDWQPAGAAGAPQQEPDPWSLCRRQDQRTAVLRLKRELYEALAEQGVDLRITPDGPTTRMVEQEIVRVQYFAHTPVDGTPEQKRKARHMQFSRALAWAEDRQLIGAEEIDGVSYLRLARPEPEDEEEAD